MPEQEPCQTCGGEGLVPNTDWVEHIPVPSSRPCPDCGGKGETETTTCPKCQDKGYIAGAPDFPLSTREPEPGDAVTVNACTCEKGRATLREWEASSRAKRGKGEGLSELAQAVLGGHYQALAKALVEDGFLSLTMGELAAAQRIAVVARELLAHTRQQERERLMFGVRRVFGHLPELVRQFEALLETAGTLLNEGSGSDV